MALSIARSFRPGVVFCDLELPIMDGYEVARQLRAFPETRDAAPWPLRVTARRRTLQQAAQRLHQVRVVINDQYAMAEWVNEFRLHAFAPPWIYSVFLATSMPSEHRGEGASPPS